MVSFEKVSKFILSDISLHIPAGTIAGVIGASGAGKTTLLRLACGLLTCGQGRVRTFSVDPVKNRRQIAADVRVFFSDALVFPEDSTILYEFEKLCFLYKRKAEEFWKSYGVLAGQMRFKEYEETPIGQLSLGQRRRAELAAALIGDCRLILLDEPTVGIDELGKEIFWKLLVRKKESGAAVMIVSSNMTEVEQLCDRMILLDEGHLLYYGDRERLMKKYAPIHEMTILFQGTIPDVEDLPMIKYSLSDHTLRLSYDSNMISAAEIARHFMEQTTILHIDIKRPELEDVIMRRKEELRR